MQEVAGVRWRKYGKDRLYVNATDGTRLGWRDLLTGADNIEPGAPAGVYHAAVTAWLYEHPSLRPTENPRASSPSHDEPLGALDGLDATPNALDGEAPSVPPAGAGVAAVVDGTGVAATTEEATQLSSPAGSATTDDEHHLVELVASLVAAHESDVAPDHQTAVEAGATGDDGWEDLAERFPGAAARSEALRLRRDKPIRTVVARVLRVHTDERAWRIGADGEEKVAVRLAKLARRDPRWRFLHAVPVGERGSDIDHLVIGPPGVFTLNAKNHPGAKIWIGGDTFMVNGHRQPYVRNSRFEARRAARLLSTATGLPVVAVGVIVPVGAADISVKKLPADVKVVNRMRLVRWLESLPTVLSPERIDALYGAARRSTTWQPAN